MQLIKVLVKKIKVALKERKKSSCIEMVAITKRVSSIHLSLLWGHQATTKGLIYLEPSLYSDDSMVVIEVNLYL